MDPTAVPLENSLIVSLSRHALKEFIPLTATIELTLNCNLRCVHCYNFDRSQAIPKEIKGTPLNRTEILRIIDELADSGTMFICFSGGEALAHPNLDEFVEHAYSKGMCVRIKSNGTLFTKSRTKRLYEAGARFTDISLYGANAETHDKFTTVPGSFAKTVQGIRHARDHGIDPTISFILHRENIAELDAIDALGQSLKVNYLYSTEITGRYDSTMDSQSHRITKEQFEELLLGPYREVFQFLNESGDVRCPCARNVCGISASGDVYPCIGSPIASGNIRDASFSEIWKHSPQLKKIRGFEIEDFKQCAPCNLRKYCTRSSGSAFVDTGNYTGAEASACMQAELRYKHANI